MYYSISARWCNLKADQLLWTVTVRVKRASRKFDHVHDIADLAVKQFAVILNTTFSTQITMKNLKKKPKIKPTLTSTIHCCRFPRLFRKPVRSSWCLQSSVNQHVLKKLIRTKFEVMTDSFKDQVKRYM